MSSIANIRPDPSQTSFVAEPALSLMGFCSVLASSLGDSSADSLRGSYGEGAPFTKSGLHRDRAPVTLNDRVWRGEPISAVLGGEVGVEDTGQVMCSIPTPVSVKEILT